MIILGLHFGHDAGAAVLVDGKIVSCVIRERQTRVKHAMTLDMQTICKALKDAGVNANQIDYCAITSTQWIELIIDNPKEFSISLPDRPGKNSFGCQTSMDKLPILHRSVSHTLFSKACSTDLEIFSKKLYSRLFPEFRDFKGKEKQFCGWIDDFISDELWFPPKSLKELSASRLSSEVKNDFLRYGLHYPATVMLQGCRLPAFFIQHHACHAASSYYQSGYRKAAILVQDGGNGNGYDSGMYYFAEENRIYPIAPHHSIIGFLYNEVAYFMNLGELAAGKLMGLAAYGKPVFYDNKFLGNLNDLVKITQAKDMYELGEHWIFHCLTRAKKMGYDLEPFGDLERMVAPINVDIAASTQKMFEENTLALVDILYDYLSRNKIAVDRLCLSGGNALNCPTNSRVSREGRFKKVFVEPGCDDSGLAIGAAFNCYYNLLDQPLTKKSSKSCNLPFLGPQIEETDILSAIECFNDRVDYEKISDWSLDAAQELEKNHVIGWFYNRSEVGPRALGHRSILADARDARNWERVNKIKCREQWRPFAPVVLESEAKRWFSDFPFPSPYMLFNAAVKSKEIPAITHVDGSSRIQTINRNNGDFYALLNEFFRLTEVPILLNTSFNGPGEPIVETPMDAINFFVNSDLDFLYMDSYKIKRKSSGNRKKRKKKSARKSLIRTAIDIKKFMADFMIEKIERNQEQWRETLELIVEDYKGFNLISFRGHFFGIRQSIGKVDLFEDLQSIMQSASPDDIMISRSLATLRDDIDGISTVQRLRQEAAIASEQAAARIGAVESKQENLNGLVKGMVEQMAAERHVADQALDKLRQEAAIASEQAAARIGAVETNQENLDGLVKGMVEQMAAERHAADQELDKLRQEASIASEQAVARIGMLESDLARINEKMAEQEQQIHLLQRSWSVRFTDVFRRRSRVSNENKK